MSSTKDQDRDKSETKDTANNTSSPQSEVYFDGDCPMCRTFAASSLTSDTNRIDFRRASLPSSINFAEAETAVHVVDTTGKIYRGADAVLHLLAKHRGFRGIATLLSAPPFIWIIRAAYRVVAANRFLLFGELTALFLLKVLALTGFLAPLLICHTLWLGNDQRLFPTTPALAFLPDIPSPVDFLLYGMLVLLCIWSAFHPRPRTTLLVLTGLGVSYALFDLNRLMPYNLEWFFFFLLLAKFPWPTGVATSHQTQAKRRLLAVSILLLSGIYLWSGLHKLNITFLMHGFSWLLSPLTQHLSPTVAAHVQSFGIFAALFEASAAIGLLFRTTRPWAAVGLLGMHCFILAMLGPWGHNFNHSVWSWNIAHSALLLLLCRDTSLSISEMLIPRSLLHALVGLWFFVLPALTPLGLWPRSLAFSLYTWAGMRAEIVIDDLPQMDTIPETLQALLIHERGDTVATLDMQRWAYAELSSPPFDAASVYRQSFRAFCEMVSNSALVRLHLYSAPAAVSGMRTRAEFTCGELISDGQP